MTGYNPVDRRKLAQKDIFKNNKGIPCLLCHLRARMILELVTEGR